MFQSGTVSKSSIFDMTFLNPFVSISKNNKEFMVGTRFGNAQFIYIIIAIISLVLVGFLSDDINKTVILIALVIYYIFLYYNLSCYLIPDNHERCFLLAWICIATVIFITLIVLFHESLFNIKSKVKKENKVSGGGKKNLGGKHCKKCKKKKGGDSHEEEINTLMKNQKGSGLDHKNYEDYASYGGDNCYEKEKKGGGGNYYKEEEKLMGGDNCYEKEKKGGGGNYYKEEEKLMGGDNCYDKEKKSGGGNYYKNEDEIIGGYNNDMEDKYMDYNKFINDTKNMTGGKKMQRYNRKTYKGGDAHSTNNAPSEAPSDDFSDPSEGLSEIDGLDDNVEKIEEDMGGDMVGDMVGDMLGNIKNM